MKNNLSVLIVIYFFIITQSLYVMEKTIKLPTFIKTLPQGTTYLFKKNVFNRHAMTIYNYGTKESKKIEKLDTGVDFIVHPYKTKIAFIYSNSIKIYDVKKNCIIKSFDLMKQRGKFVSVEFNIFNNDILLKISDENNKKSSVDIYNFDNNSYYDIKNLQQYSSTTNFFLHPQKSSLCIIQQSGHIQTLNYKKWDKTQLVQQNLKYIPNKCIVNHEKFVAISHLDNLTISILNLDNLADQSLVIKNKTDQKNKTNEKFLSMLFYPQGSILATMTQKALFSLSSVLPTLIDTKIFIQYWNILNKQCIKSILLPNQRFDGKFYFSRNGKKIIVFRADQTNKATDGLSYVYYVPWEVRYAAIKDKCLCLVVIAKRHKIPSEIIRFLMHLIKKY